MKEKNPIDELFKRRLTEGTTPFNEAHWKAMEQQLGSKKRKFGFWLWLVPVLLVLGVSVYGVVRWNENQTHQAEIQTEDSASQEKTASGNFKVTAAQNMSGTEQSISKENEAALEAFEASEDSKPELTELQKGEAPDPIDPENEDSASSGADIAQNQNDNAPSRDGNESGANSGNNPSSNLTAQNKQDNSRGGKLGAEEGSNELSGGAPPNPIDAKDEDSLPLSDESGRPDLPFDNSNFGLLERSLKMPLLAPQALTIQISGVMNAEQNLLDIFKPRNWRLSAMTSFGKYTAHETLETSSDRSVLSTFAEPVPLLSQSFGLRLDYLKRGWVFSSGLNYTTIREDVDFGVSDSTLIGFEYFEYQEIDSISTTIFEVIDSVLVANEWVYDTTYVEVQDTTFILGIDSLSIYEGGESLLDERPYRQQVSYIELPLLIGRQLPIGAKGTLTLRTGPVIGFRTVVKGYYVEYSGSGEEERQTLSDRREISKSVVFNWKTELEYAYQLSGRMSVGLLVGDRRAISPYFQNRGSKLLYKGQYIGLSLGFLF